MAHEKQRFEEFMQQLDNLVDEKTYEQLAGWKYQNIGTSLYLGKWLNWLLFGIDRIAIFWLKNSGLGMVDEFKQGVEMVINIANIFELIVKSINPSFNHF